MLQVAGSVLAIPFITAGVAIGQAGGEKCSLCGYKPYVLVVYFLVVTYAAAYCKFRFIRYAPLFSLIPLSLPTGVLMYLAMPALYPVYVPGLSLALMTLIAVSISVAVATFVFPISALESVMDGLMLAAGNIALSAEKYEASFFQCSVSSQWIDDYYSVSRRSVKHLDDIQQALASASVEAVWTIGKKSRFSRKACASVVAQFFRVRSILSEKAVSREHHILSQEALYFLQCHVLMLIRLVRSTMTHLAEDIRTRSACQSADVDELTWQLSAFKEERLMKIAGLDLPVNDLAVVSRISTDSFLLAQETLKLVLTTVDFLLEF